MLKLIFADVLLSLGLLDGQLDMTLLAPQSIELLARLTELDAGGGEALPSGAGFG